MGLVLLQPSFYFCCWLVIAAGVSSATVRVEDDDWRPATATYSSGSDAPATSGGACGFRDESRYRVAGLSTALFGRGAACGGCYELRCVDHILWCLSGSPPVVVTATDFCAPNFGLPNDDGGWCNFPNEHFELSESAFVSIAESKAEMVPVQYRRVKCERDGGMRFTVSGSSYFIQVLMSNVGWEGEVAAVKIKGWRTGWIAMGRNWGQNWQCGADLIGQPLSFEVTSGSGRRATSYNVAPAGWRFGQTFEGKQFQA